MKAVVLYKKMESARRANAILSRVEERTKEKVEWTVLFWPIRALEEEESARKTLAQAADARLIVLPAELARLGPAPLLVWLEAWAQLQHGSEAAVGILADNDSNDPQAQIHPDLSRLIQKHGLTLIANQPRQEADFGKTAAVIRPPRPKGISRIFARGYHGHPGTYRSFGIND